MRDAHLVTSSVTASEPSARLVLDAHLLKDRLDDEVCVLEVAVPRLGAIGEADHVGEYRVVAVLRQPPLLELAACAAGRGGYRRLQAVTGGYRRTAACLLRSGAEASWHALLLLLLLLHNEQRQGTPRRQQRAHHRHH